MDYQMPLILAIWNGLCNAMDSVKSVSKIFVPSVWLVIVQRGVDYIDEGQ